MSPIPTSPTTDTRDAILDAAGALLARLGYHKTTMDDLAHEAGIARRTLYLHFRCKDDIFLARIERVVERLLVELRRIAAEDGPVLDRLGRILRRRVLHRLDVVDGYVGNLDEVLAALRQPYLERRASWFASEAAVIEQVLAQGAARREIACPDPPGTARAMLTATNALLPYGLSQRELSSRAQIERTLERVVEMVLSGLTVNEARN